MEDTSPRFGCYGDDLARTPNVDALAAAGRRYSNAFTTAPVCAPSRSAAVTGCYQQSLGTHHMRTTHTNDDAPGLATPYDAVPPHYVRTVSEYFRQAGYYCTNNVKTDYQFGEPFTAWDEHHDEAGWWGRDDNRPFFAVFNNTVTHESGMWPAEERAELLAEVGRNPDGLPTEGALTTDPDAVEVPPYLPDTDPTRRAIVRQYENVHASDAWVGGLLDQLEADGLADDTIVVLWSDHGEGLPRAKRWPYDSGIRVPLIVRWPGEVDGGAESDRLVSMVDLAGAERWAARNRPAEELYDLRADPHETENLADDPDHAAARDRLRSALENWLDRVDRFGAEDERVATFTVSG
jgi:N-sulfoglucosamine sulfohydrolase